MGTWALKKEEIPSLIQELEPTTSRNKDIRRTMKEYECLREVIKTLWSTVRTEGVLPSNEEAMIEKLKKG